jgi:hypothetical protein
MSGKWIVGVGLAATLGAIATFGPLGVAASGVTGEIGRTMGEAAARPASVVVIAGIEGFFGLADVSTWPGRTAGAAIRDRRAPAKPVIPQSPPGRAYLPAVPHAGR